MNKKLEKFKKDIIIEQNIEIVWNFISWGEEFVENFIPKISFLNKKTIENVSSEDDSIKDEYLIGFINPKNNQIIEKRLIIKKTTEHDNFKALEWSLIENKNSKTTFIYELEEISNFQTKLTININEKEIDFQSKLKNYVINEQKKFDKLEKDLNNIKNLLERK